MNVRLAASLLVALVASMAFAEEISGAFANGATWTLTDGDGSLAFRDKPSDAVFLPKKREGLCIIFR